MVLDWIIIGGVVAGAALAGGTIGYLASRPRDVYYYPSVAYYPASYYWALRPTYYYVPQWWA